MEEIKMETATTHATNFSTTTTTENQNPPASLENQNSKTILENQNSPALLENLQNSTATLENQNPTALIEYHQSNYAAAAASSSKGILSDPRINAYFQSFPPGFRFKPTEEELILHYLLRKIKNQQLYPSRIHHADIYKESPSYLSANYVAATENEWYFLSPREKKYLNGDRPNRAAGNGYWKATGADKSIKSSKYKGEIGVVKTLVYYVGSPKNSSKSSWIMKEYRIKKSPRPSKSSTKTKKLDDYVLYKIYENKKNRSNATNVEGGEANDQDQADENFHYGVAQQLNIHEDHRSDELFVNGDHIGQQNHVDNMHEIDMSAGQQQQWPIPNTNYSAYYNPMFPNEMSMPCYQMQGNIFNQQNRDLMLHETLYDQQTMSDYDIASDYNPQGFSHATLPGADAFNNVQAMNYESNISEGFSQAVPPVADAPNNIVQAFNNQMKIPQMQQRQYQHRLVMTKPSSSSSSSYHPYHTPK